MDRRSERAPAFALAGTALEFTGQTYSRSLAPTWPASGVERRTCVVIADENVVLSEMMATYLVARGFEVHQVASYPELMALVGARKIDVVVASDTLQGGGGLIFLRQSASTERPAVIVASEGDDATEGIVALELGADDFVLKPYNPREVHARLQAILRSRTKAALGGGAERYLVAGLIFDVLRAELVHPNGGKEELSQGEVRLLRLMVSRPNQPFGRAELATVRGDREPPGDRAVDVKIGRLRRKLLRLGAKRLVRTDRGQGYSLTADVRPL